MEKRHRQGDGATALHWAIYRDDEELVDVLIRGGANVKAANRDGVTPLAMASLYGKPAMILKLLKAGADASEAGPNGQTPLMLALSLWPGHACLLETLSLSV